MEIERTAALAPMASVADRAYRQICKRFGAAYVVGEMASSKGLCYSDRKTEELLLTTPEEEPMAVQLFGDDPDFMARAAQKCMAYSPKIIDINMGCPVPKVAGNGSGSALMKTPEAGGPDRRRSQRSGSRAGDGENPQGLGRRPCQRRGVRGVDGAKRRGGRHRPRTHPPADVRSRMPTGILYEK